MKGYSQSIRGSPVCTVGFTCPVKMLVQVAVRNIIFNGTLHIILSPLLNSLPVVGAIQVGTIKILHSIT